MKNKVLNITDTMLAPQPLRLIKIYCKNVRECLSIAQHTEVHLTKTDFQLQEDYRTVITGASTAISDNLFTFDMAVWIPCCGAQCQLDGCVYDLVPLIHYIAVSFEASVVKRDKLVRGNGALNIDGTMPAFQSLYLFTTHGEILQEHLEYIEVQKTNSWVQEDNKANTLIMASHFCAPSVTRSDKLQTLNSRDILIVFCEELSVQPIAVIHQTTPIITTIYAPGQTPIWNLLRMMGYQFECEPTLIIFNCPHLYMFFQKEVHHGQWLGCNSQRNWEGWDKENGRTIRGLMWEQVVEDSFNCPSEQEEQTTDRVLTYTNPSALLNLFLSGNYAAKYQALFDIQGHIVQAH